jgi:hypothetical protein
MSTLEHKNVNTNTNDDAKSLTENTESVETVKGLDDSSSTAEMITIVSSDNHKFEVYQKYAEISGVIKNTLATAKDKVVSFTAVEKESKKLLTSEHFDEIVKFMNAQKGTDLDPPLKPLRSKIMKDVTTEWAADFVDKLWDKSKPFVYELLQAANYLEMNGLVHLIAAKIASVVKGKPAEEMAKVLGTTIEMTDKKDEKKNE